MREVSMPSFHINIHKSTDGIAVISIKGFLDAYTYEAAEKTFNNLFKQKQYKLIVNMSKVGYLGSAGAGVFIRAIKVVQENKGNIVINQPSKQVRDVFNLLGCSHIFTITDNLESALKTFGE